MGLRAKVLQGGLYLVIRQGMGMVISLVGVLVITRAIGPEQYGLYASAFGLFYYLQNVSQLGIAVYLVRMEERETEDIYYHQGFTLLLLIGLLGIGLSILALPLLAGWIGLKGFSSISQMLFISLPIVLLGQIPLAKMERQLAYKEVAWIELMGQIGYFLVSLPIAFSGGGAWSLVAGWWLQQATLLIMFFWVSRYKPRLCWQPKLIRQILGYSIGYSASFWVWQLRSLINPLIVGRFLGAEAVAYVALASRMVDLLGFVKSATYRLSIATLAKLQGDRVRLAKAITDGMSLQVLALIPFLVITGWLGIWFFPILFGIKWLPTMQIYPFIAASLLANALFNMHSSALYALSRNWEIAIFHIVHIALFGITSWVLIPNLGIVGYGWAEIATIASYLLIHVFLVRDIKSPNYQFAGLLAITSGLALFPYQLGWWAVLPLFVVLLLPNTRQSLIVIWKSFRNLKNAG